MNEITENLTWDQRFEKLINKMVGGFQFYTLSDNLPIIYVSDGFVQMCGYSREDIPYLFDNSHLNMVLQDDMDFVRNDITSALNADGMYSVEYRIKCKNGNIIWVMDSGCLIDFPDNKCVVQCTLTDITAHKELEADLTISEKRFKIVLNKMSDICFDYIFETDLIINYPGSTERYDLVDIITGGPETIISLGKIHPTSIEAYRRLYRRVREGEDYSKELVVTLDKHGAEVINEISLTVIKDVNNKPIMAVGIITDTTKAVLLDRERRFSVTAAQGKRLAYEANITQDLITYYDEVWSSRVPNEHLQSFDDMLHYITETSIDPEYQESFLAQSSPQALIDAYNNGNRLICIEYKKLGDNDEYEWFEKDINIIMHEITGDLNIRCYVTNINERKQNEIRLHCEQRYYDSMLLKVDLIYEVNLTKSSIISGLEQLQRRYHTIKPNDTYSEIINAVRDTIIHPDDRSVFHEFYSRRNLLKLHEAGKKELVCDYRRLLDNQMFSWVRSSIHLFEDPATNDIRGYVYVNIIDSEKKKELELIYKSQHDLLTGFFNKSTVEEHINVFLATTDGKGFNHAFFLIDIDYFKQVNDNFGHAFGDAVLSQVSQRIRALFRDGDILGRVGGDEFIVLMKNIQNRNIALIKAQEICSELRESYTKGGVNISISASIGIEFTNEIDGLYTALYSHSDAAMYQAKQNGRDQFFVYTSDMHPIHPAEEKRIDTIDTRYALQFDDSVSEYVFRLLYESNDKMAAINDVLELVGKHYGASRAYVFELSDDNLYLNNTFEWCSHAASPVMSEMQKLLWETYQEYPLIFDTSGMFYMQDVSQICEPFYSLLQKQQVKTVVQFSIVNGGKFAGFIGFDQCVHLRELSVNELNNYRNVANILGVFIIEMRSINRLEMAKRSMVSLINSMASYAYVCSSVTHELLFFNDAIKNLLPHIKVGDTCHKMFCDRDTPCVSCPMRAQATGGTEKCPVEAYNSYLGMWVKTNTSLIDWQGKEAYLINSMDISEYKSKK